MESTQERLVRYLNDAWAVEKALVDDLESMAEEVDQEDVRALFRQHREVTHQQEENLEARIRALGEEPSGGKGILSKLIEKVGDLLTAAHDPFDKTTQHLIKGYATESFEIAMYTALESYSKAIGDTQTADLARQHLLQEREAADRVWPLVAPKAARAAHAANRGERAAQGDQYEEAAGAPAPEGLGAERGMAFPASQGIGSDIFTAPEPEEDESPLASHGAGAAGAVGAAGAAGTARAPLQGSHTLGGDIYGGTRTAPEDEPAIPDSDLEATAVGHPTAGDRDLTGTGATSGGWGGMGSQATGGEVADRGTGDTTQIGAVPVTAEDLQADLPEDYIDEAGTLEGEAATSGGRADMNRSA